MQVDKLREKFDKNNLFSKKLKLTYRGSYKTPTNFEIDIFWIYFVAWHSYLHMEASTMKTFILIFVFTSEIQQCFLLISLLEYLFDDSM